MRKLRKNSVLYTSLMLAGSSVVLQLLGFCYRIILGRLAGAEVVAVHGLVMSAYNVVLSCTLTGIALSVSRIASKYLALGSGKSVRKLISTALTLFILLFTLLAIPFGFCREFFAGRILGNPDTALAMLFLVPCLFLTGFENVHKAYFYGSCKNIPPMISEILEMILRISSALLLFNLLPKQPIAVSAALIVLGMIFSEIVSATFLTSVYRRQLKKLPGKDNMPIKKILGDIVSVAAPISVATLISRLLSSANIVLIPRTLMLSGQTAEEAMIQFGAISGMTIPMLMVPAAFLSPLITVLTPRLSANTALNNVGDIRRKAGKAFHVTGLIGFPSMSIMLCMGKQISVWLYKNQNAGNFLLPLIIITLASFYYSIAESILEGIGLQKRCSVLSVTASALGLACTVFVGGVMKLGIAGFLSGELFCAIIGACICGIWVKKHTGLVFRWRNWVGVPFLSSLIAILFVRPVWKTLLNMEIFPVLIIAFCFSLFALIYSVCLRLQGTDMANYIKQCMVPER